MPQLYPLEPLVDCLAGVVGDSTLCLVAVEQRTYPAFDPKVKFAALCAARGLSVGTVADDGLGLVIIAIFYPSPVGPL